MSTTTTTTIEVDTLSPKDPAEIITIAFDFAALAASVTVSSVMVSRAGGTADEVPGALLSGSPSASGTRITQRLQGGVAGCDYLLRCEADAPGGDRYVLVAKLPVRRFG